jgi:Rrf2 family nitric oxide-sensitive transcriptional repressor
MRLTRYTDYAMRVLIHLAAHPERLCSIAEISRAYSISQNHLMKVVNDLVRQGFVASSRGRSGGIKLGRPAEEINVGAVVRHTEEGFDLVDCGALNQALGAFMGVLDGYTLADLSMRKADLRILFGTVEATQASA